MYWQDDLYTKLVLARVSLRLVDDGQGSEVTRKRRSRTATRTASPLRHTLSRVLLAVTGIAL